MKKDIDERSVFQNKAAFTMPPIATPRIITSEDRSSERFVQRHDRVRVSSYIVVWNDDRIVLVACQIVRRGARSATDTDPRQRLAAAAVDRPIPDLGRRKDLADVLRRVRQDRTVERPNWSSRFALRLRRRRDRESVPTGGPDALQAGYALSGAL